MITKVRKLNPLRNWAQRMSVTALATMVAWTIGNSFSWSDGLVAAILAVITLRVSLQASFYEGFIQILGTLLGSLIAILLITVYDNSIFAVGVAVYGAFIVTKIIGLGDEGVINIAITSLIVVGPGNPEKNASGRIWGTVIGVFVAIIFSFWAHPSSPLGRVKKNLSDLLEEISDLLSTISKATSEDKIEGNVVSWLESTRSFADRVVRIREESEESLRYARWSPLASKREARKLHREVISAEHAIVQVRGVVRSYYDTIQDGNKVKGGATLCRLLTAASRSFLSKSKATNSEEYFDDIILIDLKNILNEYKEKTLINPEPEARLFNSYLYVTLDRLIDTFDTDNPAVIEVETPQTTYSPIERIVNKFDSYLVKINLRERAKRSLHENRVIKFFFRAKNGI